MDCRCDKCCAACTNKPGWFLPGEAEQVAEYLGITLKELFEQKLVVDYYVGEGEETFVLAPTTTNVDPGGLMPLNPMGQCVFYEDGLCSIHEVKPSECKDYIHTEDNAAVADRHRAVADAWLVVQGQIYGLYGEVPKPLENTNILDVLEFLKSMIA